jgi:probable HAF family extracellular repeat protein
MRRVKNDKEDFVKNRILRLFTLAAILMVVVANAGVKPMDYEVTVLDPLPGGTGGGGNSINNRQWITGVADNADGMTRATLWKDGTVTDLGALGGDDAHSAVIWAVKNKRGVIAGISQTDIDEPLGQQWSCSNFIPFTGKTCVGFRWEDGVMTDLPTLGGYNGFATGVSKFGQIVGWTENTFVDPTCDQTRTQRLQFRAVIWGPGENDIQELLPFGDDSVSAATAINNRGQVVGISGICDRAVGRLSAIRAVIWENGVVDDMGNIGGDAWNTPMSINEFGEVVGFANVTPGPAFNAHAFRWTKDGGMEDLKTLKTEHTISQGLGINKKGQIVGISCAPFFEDCRAFIYQNGEMTDLNTLVPGFTGHLAFANDINDNGEITGGTGDGQPFLAIPTEKHSETQSSISSTKKGPLSEKAKKLIKQRLGLAAVALEEQ